MSLFGWLFGKSPEAVPDELSDQRPSADNDGLRAVPGAMSYEAEGRVLYNMLDPFMKKFMGRCIGAIKKTGVDARGTGQFSVSINGGAHELLLDTFWAKLQSQPDSEAEVLKEVVAAASELART